MCIAHLYKIKWEKIWSWKFLEKWICCYKILTIPISKIPKLMFSKFSKRNSIRKSKRTGYNDLKTPQTQSLDSKKIVREKLGKKFLLERNLEQLTFWAFFFHSMFSSQSFLKKMYFLELTKIRGSGEKKWIFRTYLPLNFFLLPFKSYHIWER